MAEVIEESELLARAATGDLDAQATMVCVCIRKQLEGVLPLEAMTGAEAFARLAAAHGHAEDQLTLAGVLLIRATHVAELGQPDRAAVLFEEADYLCDHAGKFGPSDGVDFLCGVLSQQADDGNEGAAVRLNSLMAALAPADADRLRNTLNSVHKAVTAEARH